MFLVVCGCASTPEEREPVPPQRGPIPFEKGAVLNDAIGSWKTPDGASVVILKKDGSFEIRTDTMVNMGQGGSHRVKGTDSGQWRALDGQLMLKHSGDFTDAFKMSVAADGKSMDLKAPRSPKPTHYKRVG